MQRPVRLERPGGVRFAGEGALELVAGPMSSFVNTLCRWYSTVRGLINSRPPDPQRAHRRSSRARHHCAGLQRPRTSPAVRRDRRRFSGRNRVRPTTGPGPGARVGRALLRIGPAAGAPRDRCDVSGRSREKVGDLQAGHRGEIRRRRCSGASSEATSRNADAQACRPFGEGLAAFGAALSYPQVVLPALDGL
jgi:hypothetical protein